jgi:hypothetical protein
LAQRTRYQIAGQSLLVEAQDTWAARVIDTLFAGWHLAPQGEVSEEPSAPALVMRADATPTPIPTGLQEFEIAGGGTCYTDGTTSYIDIDGSIVAIGKPGLAAAEIWTGGSPEAPALTRAVSYALSAALRQRRLFELHGSAVVHPNSERGVLIVGPSGSGKSTLTVHLASAGWSFLTDDVLLLSEEFTLVRAWPLRRCFAITSDTFAASSFLQMRSSLDDMDVQDDDKRQFAPHQVFTSEFKESCIPRTLFFSRLTGERHSRVSHLSAGDTMAGLIRMSPWSCYDRLTAAQHLAALSALARQSSSYSLLAGKDLLDSETAVDLISRCTCE